MADNQEMAHNIVLNYSVKLILKNARIYIIIYSIKYG